MKKIVFAITSLQHGGAERVLIDIVNCLKDQYDITVFSLYRGSLEKQLNKKVHYIPYKDRVFEEVSQEERKEISKMLQMPSLRKKFYETYFQGKYDVEVAFLEGPVTWMLSVPGTAKKIAWVHNDIGKVFGTGWKAKLKKQRNKKAYQAYQKLIFVSQDNLEAFEKCFPQNKVSKQVIYNYVDGATIQKKAKEKIKLPFSKKETNFLSVSRLTEQKALGRLIDVHDRLIKDGFQHHIYVLGDGPLRKELEEKIHTLKLETTFHLLGATDNPYPYMKATDYMILLSYYEGYPMVLLEGKVLNKNIIITDTAAREVLKGYDLGTIIPNNEKGIYEGMRQIIKNPSKKESKKTYRNDEIIHDIIKVIEG